MKAIFQRYLTPLLVGGFMTAMILHQSSCANTSTPPTGGPKDTIPPVITKISPFPGDTLVPRKGTKIKITFNEYVKIKDMNSILLSPPLEKKPISKIHEKSVVVSFENELDSATTYTLDLTGAIVDNNEGNPFPGYTLVFSTGNHIDSMVVTGTVRDCNTLLPLEGMKVMLYKDSADSAVFLHRPNACVKTDKWGFFTLRNIQDTIYRVYAIKDANNDNMFQPETELIAFLDSSFRPVQRVSDTLKELLKYDMLDTLHCLERHSEFDLMMFRQLSTKQLLRNKERVGDRTAYITFLSQNAIIDSIWIKGVPKEKLITQFNDRHDSLEIWVNDPKPQPDTFYLNVQYWKTDSLGVLQSTLETVKLPLPKELKAKQKSSKRDIKKDDTTNVFTCKADPTRVEQYGYEFEFKYPQVEAPWDSLLFKYINPKQKEFEQTFTVVQDSLNLRKFNLYPKGKFQKGYDYILKIPHRTFKDVNGFWNDSLEVKVSLPNDDDLSSILFKFTGTEGQRYIIDLLDGGRKNIVRNYIIDKDCDLEFPYLKEGEYSLRITQDRNRNGMVDTGDVLEHRQPEKVLFYKLSSGKDVIVVKKRLDIEQTVDLKKMFE